MMDFRFRVILLVLVLGLPGCGGAKVLKESQPLVSTQPLATGSDETVNATLDWVIFRGGPGTWAKNADWDEYLFRVTNLTSEPIEITGVVVYDSLETAISPATSRSQLVKGTREAKRRYKGEGLKVKAGMSGTLLVGTSVFVATGTTGLGAAAMAGGGAAAGAAGVVLLVPALAVGGIVRGVNNSKVNSQIEARQTSLPFTIEGNKEMSLDIFYPLSPSPSLIEITYIGAGGEEKLVIDTAEALKGLHLSQETE